MVSDADFFAKWRLDGKMHKDRLVELTDLRHAGRNYPFARAMKRRLTCHLGPTNSGKTFAAIEHLKTSSSGVYCAPLRLLAQEMHEKWLGAGLGSRIALRTGEVTRSPQGQSWKEADLLACTVEMLGMEGRRLQAAVIDEIQMLADPQRGWAFTEALLGCPAEDIYLCGEVAAWPLIEKIAQETGDELRFVEFGRLAPLRLAPGHLKEGLGGLQPGDCVVAFSRRRILQLRDELRRKRLCAKGQPLDVAVVYGSLPVENRTAQAARFNDPTDAAKLLIASDAIGMGLNLSIRRIVFDRLEKFDGDGVVPISDAQIRQIAGRAGRYGTDVEGGGVATCLRAQDFGQLRNALRRPGEHYERACIAPTSTQLESVHRLLQGRPLSAALDAFAAFGRVDDSYFLSSMKIMRRVLELVEGIDLKAVEFGELFTFLSAPVKTANPFVASHFLRMAANFAKGRPSPLPSLGDAMAGSSSPAMQLAELESQHKVLELYLWLSTRFPIHFPAREEAEQRTARVCSEINRLLAIN